MIFHKFSKNRRGIELSVNFIVMLVLAVSIFIGAMAISTKFLGQLKEQKAALDSQTEKQLEAMLDSGSLVAVPIRQKDIERKDSATFGIGIRSNKEAEYSYFVEFARAIDKKRENICPAGDIPGICEVEWTDSNLQGMEGSATIQNNKYQKFLFLIQVPSGAPSGTYLFNLKVCQDSPTCNDGIWSSKKYGTPVQLSVVVQ